MYVHFMLCMCRCTECKHKFEFLPPGPLTAGASLRCPLCEGGRVVDCVSPNDLYLQLQHLRFLLSQDSSNKNNTSGVMRLALDACHAAVPLPIGAPPPGAPRQLAASDSLVKAAQVRAKETGVGVKRGLELKFPLVVAALRYLRGLKAGVVSLNAESERKDLMEVRSLSLACESIAAPPTTAGREIPKESVSSIRLLPQ